MLLAPVLILFAALNQGKTAETVPHWAAAKEKAEASGSDIAVLLYGSDWSRAGQGLKSGVWDTDDFSKLVGDKTVLLAVDHNEGIAKRERTAKMAALSDALNPVLAAITEAACSSGSVLVKQEDGSVLATKANPANEVYTLKFRVTSDDADLLIIDFLPDDSMPHRGPGRASNGNFVINEIEAAVDSLNALTPVKITAAWSKHFYSAAEGIHLSIDGNLDPASYWNVGTHKVHETVRLYLMPESSLKSGTMIQVKIHSISKHANHTPGRIALGTASSPELCALILEENVEQAIAVGNQGMPCSSLNYPALFMLDSKGQMVGQRHGLNLKDDAASIADSIGKMRDVRIKRDLLWKVAETATGPEKATMLAKGLEVMGLGFGPGNIYKWAYDEMLKADPDDISLRLRRYTLNTGAIAGEAARLAKEESPEKGAAYFESELNHPANEYITPGQLQGLYFAQYGFYKGQEAYKARINEPLSKAGEADPTSPLGYGCAGKVLMSTGPASVRYGWAERHTAEYPATLKVGPPLESLHTYFPAPGDYQINLAMARGESMEVTAISMLIGDQEIPVKGAPATIETMNRTATFLVSMPAIPDESPVAINITVNGTKPSGGTIRITPASAPVAESTPSGRNAGEFVRLFKILASRLTARHRTTGPDDAKALTALAKDETYLHQLTQHEVLRLVGPEKLEPVIATQDGAAFIDRFLSDQEWMTMWLVCGNHTADPAKELTHLATLMAHDPDLLYDPTFKRLATAVAVAAGGSVPRYDYFKESHELGRLHRVFYEHPTWVMRFMLGIGEDDGRYLRDHYSKPIHTYGNIHYQAAYRLHSIFGDSIHGSQFFAPWQGLPKMQQIKYAGGVCGSLTTLGEYIFKSAGIPALGMSEPGHRSYVVRFSPGYWRPIYSLANPKRTNSFYGGLYEDLGIMEKVWADLPAVRAASIHLWQARLYAGEPAQKGEKKAMNVFQRTCYGLALDAHPIFLDAWFEWIALAKNDPTATPAQWIGLTKAMISKVAPLGEKTLFNLWRRYEDAAVAGQTPADMVDTHMAMQQAFLQQYPDGFGQLTALLTQQTAHLGGDPEATAKFYQKVLDTYASQPASANHLVNWCADLAAKFPAQFAQYVGPLVKKLALDAPDTPDALKRSAYTRLLTLARDKNLFEAYHQLAASADKALPLDAPAERYLNDKQLETYPKLRPFRGDLLSDKGLIRCWQPAKYDRILQYHRMLDPRGGYVHANPNKDAWITVELPRPARLSGINIVNRYELPADDQVPLIVAISADGKTWKDVFTSEENLPAWQVDLTNTPDMTRFVKVYTKREKPAYFQLRNILIYGKE